MIPQKDYLVDRRNVEVLQGMERKRTNRDIDFLRSLLRGVWTPKRQFKTLNCFFGLHGEGETLDPIPNSKVKPFSGYNTWVLALGK